MELIRTLKERAATRRQQEIHQWAEQLITLDDFDSQLYIAYNGTPLIPVKDDWTPKEIIEELSKVRQNYIKSKTPRTLA